MNTEKQADTNQKLREQADHFYLQGLHIFAHSPDSANATSTEHAARLWLKAWDLYHRLGDKTKAKELKKSLATLYKRKYLKVHGKKQRHGIIAKFKDWFMFFKIGCFGFGGPMAVFTLLQDELVREKQILTDKDFLEGAVLGDVLPGPVTMDIVTYTGYKLKKWSGALISTLVFILPSFLLMLAFAMLYDKYRITPKIEQVFKCLGAAVTGLIVSVGLNLSKSEMKDYRELLVCIWAFASALIFKLDIVVIVALAGLAGIILYYDDTKLKQLK
ncbi:MAG: chromate transporter [Planctomycetota bacterium]|jgi:chromate transporter